MYLFHHQNSQKSQDISDYQFPVKNFNFNNLFQTKCFSDKKHKKYNFVFLYISTYKTIYIFLQNKETDASSAIKTILNLNFCFYSKLKSGLLMLIIAFKFNLRSFSFISITNIKSKENHWININPIFASQFDCNIILGLIRRISYEFKYKLL